LEEWSCLRGTKGHVEAFVFGGSAELWFRMRSLRKQGTQFSTMTPIVLDVGQENNSKYVVTPESIDSSSQRSNYAVRAIARATYLGGSSGRLCRVASSGAMGNCNTRIKTQKTKANRSKPTLDSASFFGKKKERNF
jgi:hypothetical protein